MSYDLYFVTRNGARLDAARVEEYFSGRLHYQCGQPEYFYSNDDTGVYFQFTLDEYDTTKNEARDEDAGCETAALFNINFCRPSYFIHEAEPEVSAFVKAFDLTVVDPQMEGMGEGEYEAARLISGWNKGNEFGYQAILGGEEAGPQSALHLPAATLRDAWRWNHAKQSRQEAFGTDIFLPRVAFMKVNGALSTVAVWPDAIPIATPRVGHFIVGRDQLAPKRFFMRRKDMVVISWEQALPWLQKYRASGDEGFYRLDYAQPPADIAAFIQELPAVKPELEGVPADQVLDRELVEAALAKPRAQPVAPV